MPGRMKRGTSNIFNHPVKLPVLAKDIRVVVFKVSQMHCEKCEKKVKDNMRFEVQRPKLSQIQLCMKGSR